MLRVLGGSSRGRTDLAQTADFAFDRDTHRVSDSHDFLGTRTL